ncbi:helix-turn-helix domain-containing protein [Halobacteriales archaeon SW_12_71_31]|nr:MAG: helix-turn-helix domain-containing protein [Halobacteriales archaeon SW_12_71_31]
MPYAELTVTLPSAVWIGALSREFSETTFRVLSAIPRDRDGVGLVEVSGTDPTAVLTAMSEKPTVTAAEVVHRNDDTAVVQFETTAPLLLSAAQASGMPLSLPLEISDGRAHVRVTASRDRIAALGEELEELELSYTLDRLYDSVTDTSPLSPTQREALLTAVERGYYDTPRDISLTELAEELNTAKSSLSGTLHRAEETVVKTFVTDRLDADVDMDSPSH